MWGPPYWKEAQVRPRREQESKSKREERIREFRALTKEEPRNRPCPHGEELRPPASRQPQWAEWGK